MGSGSRSTRNLEVVPFQYYEVDPYQVDPAQSYSFRAWPAQTVRDEAE